MRANNNGNTSTVDIKIVGGTSFARNKKITTEATYNMRVTGRDVGEPSLVGYPGYKAVLDFKTGEAREIYLSSRTNTVYACFGNKIIQISPSLSHTVVGELDTTKGPVFMVDNQNNELAIVDGQQLYVYNYSTGVFNKPVVDFSPQYIAYQDTFLIVTAIEDVTGASIWQISGSNTAQVWDPLARVTMQTKADNIQAAVPLLRQMWVIGNIVSEVWYNQGLTPFAYARDNSIALPRGCISLSSIAEGFGKIVWFARNEKASGNIVVTQGGEVQTLSNDGLDFLFSSLKNPEDSYGFLFEEDGHEYYQITFNKDNLSIVYDFTEKLFYNVTDESLGRYIAKRVVFFENKLYFISFLDSKIYEMSSDIPTYDGKEVPRIRITPHLRFSDNSRFIVSKIQLQLENGDNVGGQNDRIDLSISRDGGYTYGAIVGRNMNPLGVRQSQFIYNRLGSANDFTAQFRFWGLGPFVITNATADIIR